MYPFLITLLAALTFVSPLHAQEPTDPFEDPLIKSIQARHDKGIGKDKEGVIALAADLEKLTREQPKNYLLLAYLGSTYTLRSRDIGFGPKAYTYLRDGLKLMDQAVDATPKNIAVRFIRAINNYNLPFFCNRKDNAREDFKTLLQQLESGKSDTVLNPITKQAIYYYAGLSCKQLNDKPQAQHAWEVGEKIDPSSTLAPKIREELAKLKK